MINGEKVKRSLIVIGASAGGLEALHLLFKDLPSGIPAAICVVVHRSSIYNENLAMVMRRWTQLPLVEPDRESVSQGTIYLAPRDHHLILDNSWVHRWKGPAENRFRPSIDPLFRSAAASYGDQVVGVILSGVGSDGVAGLAAIKKAGGVTLVQDPSDAVMGNMPRNAIRTVQVDAVLPLVVIADSLTRLAKGETLVDNAHAPKANVSSSYSSDAEKERK